MPKAQEPREVDTFGEPQVFNTGYEVAAYVEERQRADVLCVGCKEMGIYPEGTRKPTMSFKQ